MRISTRGRYSLEALLYMTIMNTAGETLSTRTISEATGISSGYLEQLFIPLKQAGILEGSRGPKGGYRLALPATVISVGTILRCMENSLQPKKESPRIPDDTLPNPARQTWQDLQQAITLCIDSISLASLAEAYRNMTNQEFMI